ncbi:MAG: nicotinate-nucleotide adenylyltransferase [Ignavibacteria bacterium]
MPEPLGILGGTFDPVHRAHLHLARAALAKLGLASIVWIPAGRPYHRHAPHADAAHRVAMVRLATADEPRFTVDAADATAAQPSLTVPTLERLRSIHGPAQPFVLLVGADAFLGLPSWHRWRELFGLAHIAVAARPGSALDAARMIPELAALFEARRAAPAMLAAAPAGSVVEFEIEPVEPADLSATMVRELLRDARNDGLLADLLPSGVLDYIRRNHLYTA